MPESARTEDTANAKSTTIAAKPSCYKLGLRDSLGMRLANRARYPPYSLVERGTGTTLFHAVVHTMAYRGRLLWHRPFVTL